MNQIRSTAIDPGSTHAIGETPCRRVLGHRAKRCARSLGYSRLERLYLLEFSRRLFSSSAPPARTVHIPSSLWAASAASGFQTFACSQCPVSMSRMDRRHSILGCHAPVRVAVSRETPPWNPEPHLPAVGSFRIVQLLSCQKSRERRGRRGKYQRFSKLKENYFRLLESILDNSKEKKSSGVSRETPPEIRVGAN